MIGRAVILSFHPRRVSPLEGLGIRLYGLGFTPVLILLSNYIVADLGRVRIFVGNFREKGPHAIRFFIYEMGVGSLGPNANA